MTTKNPESDPDRVGPVTKARTVVYSMSEFMFEAQANSPETWQLCSYELIGAANLCFGRHVRVHGRHQSLPLAQRATSSGRAPLMLYAFGIEGLLKALWLAQKNRSTHSKPPVGRQLTKVFKSHDLRAWWERTAMPPPSDTQKFLLDMLTHYGEVGRYPVLARPHALGRYRFTGDIKGACVDLAALVDREIRRLRPMQSSKLGPVRLGSLGVRSFHARKLRPAR
jgi:hypothetical protein